MAPDDDPDLLDLDDLPQDDSSANKDSRGTGGGFVGDFVRRFAVAGLGAVFMTEEGIRNLAGQLKLPKEVLGYILSQAEKTKEDLGRVVTEEVRRFLQSEKLREEFVRLMSGMTVEVTAQVRLVPDDKKKEAAAAPPAEPPAAESLKIEPVVTGVTTRRTRRTPKE
jgi:hypothetical protein